MFPICKVIVYGGNMVGEQANFSGSGGIPSSPPPLGETLLGDKQSYYLQLY